MKMNFNFNFRGGRTSMLPRQGLRYAQRLTEVNIRRLASILWPAGIFALLFIVSGSLCAGQERPYFVTYTHEMEEPGNLEIAMLNVTGKPSAGNRFWGSSVELEYGVTGWWTTELYLDG